MTTILSCESRGTSPCRWLGLALAWCLSWNLHAAAPDLVVADFEGDSWGKWVAAGEAFGPKPASGTLPSQMNVDGFLGKGLVNSFHGGDDTTGTLTSPPFKLERRYLRFLIGGGMKPGQACINLLVDGRQVRTATGPNDRPGGTEHLDWDQWDVTDLAGRMAVIQIVDQAKGGWGHINIDHLMQTDERLPGWQTDARREIRAEKKYLHLPIKNGAPRRLMSVLADGQWQRQFEIELADGEPDWWAFLELEPFRGRSLVLQVDKLKEDSKALASMTQGDEVRGDVPVYQEKLRPQFHFTSRRGWNNDPNGLVYQDGEYHLFYQHNPYGWNWGNMHWGHAVSPDLVHWRELGEALYPDAQGTMFSGSAVVDDLNTTGWGRGSAKPLICIYTAAGGTSALSKGQPFTQGAAYSLDRGRTWTKYEKNPILAHIAGENRDPKVIWHEPTRRWVMALYLKDNDYALFGSSDLKSWEKLCDVKVPGTSECPEFFEIAVAGTQETRWVFYGGNGRYLVGRFDGRTFTPDEGPHALNFGNCFYASQTFTHIPKADGRRILVPWGQVNLPGMPFNQMMGLPIELTLHRETEGMRLRAVPAREFESLRKETLPAKPGPVGAETKTLDGVSGELLDLNMVMAVGGAQEIQLKVRGVPVTYDAAKGELRCLDRKGSLKPIEGKIRLRILVDRASIDIFANDGRLYMPMGVILPEGDRSVSLQSTGGAAKLESVEGYRLGGIWE